MAGKTILAVDGNETSRIFLSSTLCEKQFHILEASFPEEASIFAWRAQPDHALFRKQLMRANNSLS